MLHQFFTFSPNVLTMVNCPSIIFHSKGELLFWSYKLNFFTYSYVNVRPSIVKTPKYNFGKANFDGSVISIVYQIPFSNYFPTLSFRTSKPLYNSPFCNKKVKKLKGHFWQGTTQLLGPWLDTETKLSPENGFRMICQIPGILFPCSCIRVYCNPLDCRHVSRHAPPHLNSWTSLSFRTLRQVGGCRRIAVGSRLRCPQVSVGSDGAFFCNTEPSFSGRLKLDRFYGRFQKIWDRSSSRVAQ